MTRWPFSPPAIGVALTCEGPAPSLTDLARWVRERWGLLPRLSWVLTPRPPRRRTRGGHTWSYGSNFEPALHISYEPSPESYEQRMQQLLTEPFPPDLPPWRLHVLPDPSDTEFTLLLRVHHALFDGRSMINLARILLGEPPGQTPAQQHRGGLRPLRQLRNLARSLRTSLTAGTAVPMPSPGVPEPAYAWRPVPLDLIHRARTTLPSQATTSEVLLAAVAGVLRAGLGPAQTPAPRQRPVFASVPIDTRPAGYRHRLGNDFGVARIALPTNLDDPKQRLAACTGLLEPALHRPALTLGRSLLRAASAVNPALIDKALAPSYEPAYSAASCTFLPLPGKSLALDHRPLRRLRGFLMVPPPGTAAFFLLGSSSGYTLNVVSNASSKDAQVLADAMLRELGLLAGHTPAQPPVNTTSAHQRQQTHHTGTTGR
ncbi:wax ester/triacylglycerol synthase domain-containing protein [Streptomyces cinereoruber]|uniref:wax ester/triacylglycerol synthase domain-containing protein n=1 Tax=Streptomyces cinereoruber TaxID=67260 RepID=UPI003641E9EA